MRLWTVQPYSVYELIQKEGIYRCDANLSDNLKYYYQFVNAYEWICKKMKERIGNPPAHTKYPVWAWYAVEGEHRRPDMRKCYLKVFEKSVLLELEIPDTEVLLTDHTMWHRVLNNSINYKANYMDSISSEEWEELVEQENNYYNILTAEEKKVYKEKSWEKIICSPESSFPKYVQATFWELKESQIKKVWILGK